MTATRQYTVSLVESDDPALVGGKGANLGRLLRAKLPVPDGFVVDTHAYRLAHAGMSEAGGDAEIPPEVASEIRERYQTMGGGAVAVRSSATAEDAVAASMAGQCETYLDVHNEAALLVAVQRCWASLRTPRLAAYLAEHGIDATQVAMAIVIQRLVPAEVAGVLFTADPKGRVGEMLIEANWGLGETVVGGHVQPDVLRLDAKNGRVLAAAIADKAVYLSPGSAVRMPVEESRRKQPCLGSREVHSLWQLGRRAEEYFAAPQDIEWAIHEGKFYLLQSRPITTQREAEAAHEIMQSTRRHLREELAAQRGPWALHNIAETLPHPTALTWSVIRRFMSGSGGFGAMYRKAGFQPSAAVEHDGFLELIAGRVYMDVSRSTEMLCENFPFRYDVEELHRDPGASQKPPSTPSGSLLQRIKAAGVLTKASAQMQNLAAKTNLDFRERTAPAIKAWVAGARRQNLAALSNEALMALWQECETKVFDEFGPETFLPSLICANAWAELEAFLSENFWDDEPSALLRSIAVGGEPDHTVIADAELFEVAHGKRTLEAWLAEHGHRGAGEFDLATPRWREQPAKLREMADRLKTGEPPLERFKRSNTDAVTHMAELRAKLPAVAAREFDRRLERLRCFIPFREEGKDLMMLGYESLRDVAVEAGRRLDVGDGIFHLTRDEMFDALRVGFAPHHLIEERQLAYRAELRLTLPRVIDAAAIERLGEATEMPTAAGGYKALAISGGRASGQARVLHSATEAGDFGTGYILVCPSTDPSWTPLFVNAAGLVLECGGALSHGAVVAREMGLPAVVLGDATRLFRTGENIEVNGNNGWVGGADSASAQTAAVEQADPNNPLLPRALIPPPPGRKDRRAATWSNAALAFWTMFLLGFFFLPVSYLQEPSLALMDFFLWPLVNALGKPAVVAILAGSVCALTLIMQKLVTNNRALLEAKRRAAILTRQARTLPANSRRRAAMLAQVAGVNRRLLLAGLVPIALLLGPLMLPFVWFNQRIDPAVPAAVAGSPVQIVASVDGEWTKPVRLETAASFACDDATPALRTLPPLRATLERLLTLYRQPQADPNAPWELHVAPDVARTLAADDLANYLAAGLPPQSIAWTIRPPKDAAGRYPIRLTAEGFPPLTVTVVLGREFPPRNASAAGASGSPLKELRVVYPGAPQRPVFWQPFAGLNAHTSVPFAARLADWDTGWLWLYVLAYLPLLFVGRALLRVA